MGRVSAIGVLLLALAGCGTAKNLTGGYKGQTKPYGGVKIAANELFNSDPIALGIFWPFLTADLALSAVGDTFTLPLSISAEIVRGINDHYSVKEKPPETMPAP